MNPRTLFFSTFLLFLFVQVADAQTTHSPRFNYVLHDTLEQADVRHLSRALDENYERIAEDLRVPDLPVITVQIWSDEDAYQDAMEQTLGMRFPGSRGYVTGDQEMQLLYHRRLSAQKEAVHEFAHVVSLNLNPEFGNNPRWLWEATAMYVAQEKRNLSEINYLQARDFPTLAELNEDFNSGRNIYDVGYLLIEYIVETWNHDTFVALISANGNIEAVLNVTEAEFDAGWRAYVERKYLDQ
jgi:hypothetical protein